MKRDPSRTERIVALLRQACVGSGAGERPEDRSWLMSTGILSAIAMARSRRIYDVGKESVHSPDVGAAGIREPQCSL